MGKKSIVCRSCGQMFEADSALTRAFCLYCGAENDITSNQSPWSVDSLSALPAEPATRRALLEQLAAAGGADAAAARERLLFWPARYEAVDRHATRYGDKFIEFISILLFYSQNYPSRGSQKRARKERDKFLARPALVKAMAEAVHPEEALLQEFRDAAEVYLKACRDDKHYGSKLFELVKLKEDDVAAKAAGDVASGVMAYLVQLGMTPQTDLMIQGLHMAWTSVFSKFPDFLDEAIGNLPAEHQAAINRVLSRNPSHQEEQA